MGTPTKASVLLRNTWNGLSIRCLGFLGLGFRVLRGEGGVIGLGLGCRIQGLVPKRVHAPK